MQHTDLSFKIKVIECYNKHKYKTKELLDIFQVSSSSFYYWLNQYKTGTLGERKQRIEKTTPEMKFYIRTYVIRHINFNYKKLISMLNKKYKILISKSSLYNVISKLKITRKK